MNNKITFGIITVAIAAVIAGISAIVLDNGIQSADAQNRITPPGPPSGSEGQPYGQYLTDPSRNLVGQNGQLNEQIQDYLGSNTGLGDIRSNDNKYGGDFRDEVVGGN